MFKLFQLVVQATFTLFVVGLNWFQLRGVVRCSVELCATPADPFVGGYTSPWCLLGMLGAQLYVVVVVAVAVLVVAVVVAVVVVVVVVVAVVVVAAAAVAVAVDVAVAVSFFLSSLLGTRMFATLCLSFFLFFFTRNSDVCHRLSFFLLFSELGTRNSDATL